jgi:hypothetical protein
MKSATNVDRITRILPWLMALSLALVLVPIYCAPYFPSIDTMLHLARCAILDRRDSAFLQDLYTTNLQPIPNLAIDVVVPFLARFMSVQEAGRTFMVLTILLQIVGGWGIVWAVRGTVTPLMLLVPVLCWNFILTWGFASYSFGVGIALCVIALHLLLRGRNRWLRLFVLSLSLTLTYFAHLAAFGMLLLVLTSLELSDSSSSLGQRLQAIALILIAAVPSAAVHLFLSPIGESTGTDWGPMSRRLLDFAGMFSCYRGWPDLVVSAVVAVGLFLLWRSKSVSIDRNFVLAIVLCLIVFALAPWRLFGSHFTNTRLIVFFWFMLVASFTLEETSLKVRWRIAVGALAVLVLQSAIHSVRIANWSSLNLEMDRMAGHIPAGSLVLSMENADSPAFANTFTISGLQIPRFFNDPRLQPPSSHVFDQVLLRKDVFIPQLYLLPGKQPVEVRAKYYDTYLAANTLVRGDHPVRREEFSRLGREQQSAILREFEFDSSYYTRDKKARIENILPEIAASYGREQGLARRAFLVYRHNGSMENPLPAVLRPIDSGAFVSLYEIVSDQSPAGG